MLIREFVFFLFLFASFNPAQASTFFSKMENRLGVKVEFSNSTTERTLKNTRRNFPLLGQLKSRRTTEKPRLIQLLKTHSINKIRFESGTKKVIEGIGHAVALHHCWDSMYCGYVRAHWLDTNRNNLTVSFTDYGQQPTFELITALSGNTLIIRLGLTKDKSETVTFLIAQGNRHWEDFRKKFDSISKLDEDSKKNLALDLNKTGLDVYQIQIISNLFNGKSLIDKIQTDITKIDDLIKFLE